MIALTTVHIRTLNQYWHTEPEAATAARLGVSRGAAYMIAYRLRRTNPAFAALVNEREDDYQWEVIGHQRALQGHFRGWTAAQQALLWEHWHTRPDAEIAALIGKDRRACAALSRRLRHRDPQFRALMDARQESYDKIVEAARQQNAAARRWRGHVPTPRIRKVRQGRKPDENHLFRQRFLTPNRY